MRRSSHSRPPRPRLRTSRQKVKGDEEEGDSADGEFKKGGGGGTRDGGAGEVDEKEDKYGKVETEGK